MLEQNCSSKRSGDLQKNYVVLPGSRRRASSLNLEAHQVCCCNLRLRQTPSSILTESSPKKQASPLTSISESAVQNRVFLSKKMKAILFINIYCICDTVDNINAKTAMRNDVKVIDLTLSRITFNFISACCFVFFCGQHISDGVPNQYRFALGYRSFMMTVSQTFNVFSIALLPLSMLTIVQNTQAFWIVLLGFMINKERFLKIELVGIFACFVGVIMMAASGLESETK